MASWGGKRAGAGRKKSSPFVTHETRPTFARRKIPLKVEMTLRSDLPSLLLPDLKEAFRRGSIRAKRFGLRILHYSIFPKKIEIICELKSQKQLESSFKSLNTTMAIAVKRYISKTQNKLHKGPVFVERFKLHLLDTEERIHWGTSSLTPIQQSEKKVAQEIRSSPQFPLSHKLIKEISG